MHVHFLGGANEVGASSTFITIEGQRVLVDAGIRMNSTPDKQLPDFSQLDTPSAVLLTHAHTDHTGALPVLIRDHLPEGVKVYSTAATKDITQVLLKDSAKRKQKEGDKGDGKPPEYTCDDVDVALNRIEEVPNQQGMPICDGALTATWIPSGHILGAAMIYIKGKRESLLMTGDVSVADQLTVPGVVVPEWCRPDIMVMESTYGNRPHKDRAQQEAALIRDATDVIEAGGKVLIPAFAVARSQEVILILKDTKKIPVYVDGMVLKVNEVYSRFVDDLSPSLRLIAQGDEDIFYSPFVNKVDSKDHRDRILSGPPCCIVASSGMLNGGVSNCYAKRLAGDPKNLIAITGYQAEGTPGRKLLEENVLNLDEQEVSVKCKVKQYSLSAHADQSGLTHLVEKVQPRKLFLVHGDAKAREGLKQSIQKMSPAVHVGLPQNGDPYDETKRWGIAGGRCLSHKRILREVFDFVRKIGLQGPFRVRELAEMWFGTDKTTTTRVQLFQWFLSIYHQEFFVPDGQCRGLFHPKRIA